MFICVVCTCDFCHIAFVGISTMCAGDRARERARAREMENEPDMRAQFRKFLLIICRFISLQSPLYKSGKWNRRSSVACERYDAQNACTVHAGTFCARTIWLNGTLCMLMVNCIEFLDVNFHSAR